MTITVSEPPLESTQKLVTAVVRPALVSLGARVKFNCPVTTGPAIVQRMRVMISRSRKRLKLKGKPYAKFLLRSEIYTCTNHITGKREDTVVVWVEQTERDRLEQDLEELLK